MICCSKCVIVKHMKHNARELKDVVSKLRNQLQQAVQQTQASKEEVIKAIKLVEHKIEEMKVEEQNGITQVNKTLKLRRGQYFQPKSRILETIDGLYLTPQQTDGSSTIYYFQVTVGETHSLKWHGI